MACLPIWILIAILHCGIQRPGMRGYCHPQHFQPLPNALYHNQVDGTFRDVSIESGIAAHPGKGMGIAIGDYDLDGRIDVFGLGKDTSAKLIEIDWPSGTKRRLQSVPADRLITVEEGRESY